MAGNQRPPILKSAGTWLIGPGRMFRRTWNSDEASARLIEDGSKFLMHARPDPLAIDAALQPAVRSAVHNKVTLLRVVRILFTYVGGALAATALTQLIADAVGAGHPSILWTGLLLFGVAVIAYGELLSTTTDLLREVVLPRFSDAPQ